MPTEKEEPYSNGIWLLNADILFSHVNSNGTLSTNTYVQYVDNNSLFSVVLLLCTIFYRRAAGVLDTSGIGSRYLR